MTRQINLNKGFSVLVDNEDYSKLSKYTWWINDNGYAVTKIGKGKNRRQVSMHRLIMNNPECEVDHKNRNKLDNRKLNLRLVTQHENSMNKSVDNDKIHSIYKGLTRSNNSPNWVVRIKVDKKSISIGNFSNEVAGANAYNYYANIYHGEFAGLNDVPFMSKEEWGSYKTKNMLGNNIHSIYKGVTWHKFHEKWTSTLYYSGKSKSLGYYDTEIEALIARNEAIIEMGLDQSKIQEVITDDNQY